ncbi:MAG: CDP-glycerol glycerophosphotransferase family protein [Wujia sp.]
MKFWIKQWIKMLFQHVVFPLAYVISKRKPVQKGLVVFADAHKTACPQQMKVVRDAVIKQGYAAEERYFDLKELSALQGMLAMLKFMPLYARAEYVFLQDNFLPVAACKKRKETKVIQLWHGCGAFKKFGYDAKDDIPKYYKGNVYRNYDLVTVSGPICREYFASAMRISGKRVQALGCAYTDLYYDPKEIEKTKDKFKKTFSPGETQKVIVWAPTFRGNAGVQEVAEPVGWQAIRRLQDDKSYYVIQSLHPHMQKEDTKLSMSTTQLMQCADLLITDYSSVFFEYLLLDKPIVFYAPDLEAYKQDRGWYLDYDALPGQIVTNRQDLQQAVYAALWDEELRKQEHIKREKFRERYMAGCDGFATNRILEYMKKTEIKG